MIRRNSPTRVVRSIADDGSQTRVQHVGLAHEKLAPHAHDGDKEAQSRFVRNLAANSGVPTGYALHFRRHVRRTPVVTDGPWQRRAAVVISQGRVLCGLGERTPTENGLTVHTTYGVPVLPGSSLKGIAKAWLRESAADGDWAPGGALYQQAFGEGADSEDPDTAGGLSGLVHFLDALWVPGDSRLPAHPWAAEILTPHFGDYYRNDRRNPAPDGTQSPIPITFLAAQGGFRVVLEGPDELVDQVLRHLLDALRFRGVGAKGRSGFGRFDAGAPNPDGTVSLLTRDDEQEAAAREEAEAARARAAAFDAATDIVAMLTAFQAHGDADTDLRQLVADWLVGSERAGPRLQKFPVTPDAAAAAYAWAQDANVAKGLVKKVRDDVSEDVLAAMLDDAGGGTGGTVAPSSASGGAFGPNHLDVFDDPTGLSKKNQQKWPNKFADRIAGGQYDEDTVQRAMAHLAAHGGKDGHLKKIREAYGLGDGG